MDFGVRYLQKNAAFILAVIVPIIFLLLGRIFIWDSTVDIVFPGHREKAREIIAPKGDSGKVYIIVVDYLGIEDIKELPPNLGRVFSSGASGLINVNTGGLINLENSYATLGAGAHIIAPSPSSSIKDDEEDLNGDKATIKYRQWTGRVPPEGFIVYSDIEKIKFVNRDLKYPVFPGAMGTALRGRGLSTAVFGNCDSINGPRRPVVTMIMDNQGYIDTGLIDRNVLKKDNQFPGEWITDYHKLLEEINSLPDDVRLIGVNIGDLSRLRDVREYMAEDEWSKWRRNTMGYIDCFMDKLLQQIDPESDLVILLSTVPGENNIDKKDKLSPVAFYGGPIEQGIVTSPSTKRPGIIKNLDIAPTVLKFIGIKSESIFMGEPVRVIPGGIDVSVISKMHEVLSNTYELRPYILKGYVLFQIIVLSFLFVLLFLRFNGRKKYKWVLLWIMSVPLALLIIPLLPPAGIFVSAAELLVTTMLIVMALVGLNKKNRNLSPLLLVCLVTSAAISLDIATGSYLQKASILGYDPIAGARFYGLGNEYMGVLIGSTLMGTAVIVNDCEQRRRSMIILTCVVYLVVILLVSAPQLGTNVGGLIAASTSFLLAILLFLKIRFSWKNIVVFILGIIMLLISLIAYDISRPAEYQSHIGRTASMIIYGGNWEQVVNIIGRKIEMNIKLIKYTIWSRVLLASIGIMGVLFYRPTGVMESIKRKFPYVFIGLIGVTVGSGTALIFNDSGVVSAATAMIFGITPLIYLVLEQQ